MSFYQDMYHYEIFYRHIMSLLIGCTPRGSCDNTPTGLLRRVLEIAFEKVLRRVLRRCLAVGFRGKKGCDKGS